MRTMLMLGAATAALFTAGTADAAKIFTVSGNFSSTVGGTDNVGSLSGQFTTSDDLSTLVGYTLTSTASGNFRSITYTTANSSAVYLPGAAIVANETFIKLSLSGTESLLLNFDGPLTSSGVSLVPGLLGSLESQTRFVSFSGTRFLTGTIAAVPEPATWGMMLLGFGLVAGVARYRRRSTAVTYA